MLAELKHVAALTKLSRDSQVAVEVAVKVLVELMHVIALAKPARNPQVAIKVLAGTGDQLKEVRLMQALRSSLHTSILRIHALVAEGLIH